VPVGLKSAQREVSSAHEKWLGSLKICLGVDRQPCGAELAPDFWGRFDVIAPRAMEYELDSLKNFF